MLREMLGLHTAQKRGPLSHVLKLYPDFDIEPGAAEEDMLWVPDAQETFEDMDPRQQAAFDVIFSEKNAEHRCEPVCFFPTALYVR